jgi:dethiobiotin synthetase
MRGLFVTGTDTGVGKTWVTAAVARLLGERGRAVRVAKPVATGAAWVQGRWLSDDTRLLAEAAGETDLEAVTPWAFATPAAPPVAARLAGTTLTLGVLAGAVRRRASPGAGVLVEGVGGLLCPLTEREVVADLAAGLGLPLVVVARRSLGTLNHTLLTLEAARARGLAVRGVVVSETSPVAGVAEETNVEELRRRVEVPLLAVAPHRPGGPAGVVAALAAVDWWGLMGEAEEGERARRHGDG